MTYKVSLSSGNNYSVKIPQSQKYKINYQLITQLMPQSLNELTDVELSGNNYDKYVLLYDFNCNLYPLNIGIRLLFTSLILNSRCC